MKRCPFCAEEIQDEAKLCRWCLKDLPVPKIPVQGVLRQVGLVCLFLAVVSFFMPLVRLQFPMMGAQSFSGASIAFQLIRPEVSGHRKARDGQFSVDVRSLQQMMQTDEGVRVFRSKPVYWLIPFGFICGAMAYVLLIPVFVVLWIQRFRAVSILSAYCLALLLILWVGIFFLNDLLQSTLHASMIQMRDNPFAGLAASFMQGIRIEPAGALYGFGITIMLLMVVGWGISARLKK